MHVFIHYSQRSDIRGDFSIFLLLLQRLLAKLTNKEKEVAKLTERLDFEKV